MTLGTRRLLLHGRGLDMCSEHPNHVTLVRSYRQPGLDRGWGDGTEGEVLVAQAWEPKF